MSSSQYVLRDSFYDVVIAIDIGFLVPQDIPFLNVAGDDVPVVIIENNALPSGAISVIRTIDLPQYRLNRRLVNEYSKELFKFSRYEKFTPE